MAEATLNRVEVIGRLPEDARTTYTEGGVVITRFYVQVGKREYADDPDIAVGSKGVMFVPCILFNQATVGASLLEGMRVMVLGFLNSANSDDKNYKIDVVVNRLIMMDKPRRMMSPPVKIAPKVPTTTKKRWKKV